MDRSSFTELEQLPNVGPAIANKLRQMGIHKPSDIIGRDPFDMIRKLESITGKQHDPCLLDVFISVTRFMTGEPKKPWWAYTAERKRVLAEK